LTRADATIVLSQQVYQIAINGNKHVDISTLPAGNYLLQIVSANGDRINKKIVKQ
jgi:hypothetical protein